MRIVVSIALFAACLASAKMSLAQVPDPSACASTFSNGSWSYPDRSSCLNVVNAVPHHIFGIGDRTLVGHRSVMCDWSAPQDARYVLTPDFGLHNASENYTHYVTSYNGSEANCDNEPSGFGWDMDTTWTFGPAQGDPISMDPTTGFTIMMKVWIDAGESPTASQAQDYVTLSASSDSKPVYVLGREGLNWGLGARASNSSSTGYYWQFPWAAQAYAGYFQLVFYTFNPNGKVEIDSFHDENDQGSTPSTDFESALIDFGSPSTGLPAGTPTSNPQSFAFYPLTQQMTLGKTLGNDSYGTGLVEVTLWDKPLSRGEVAAYADSQHGRTSGTFYPNPCNTGYMLNAAPPLSPPPGMATVPTNRCGYASNWSRTSAAYSVAGSASPSTLTFASSGEALPITFTNTGSAPVVISDVALSGADPEDFIESNSCPASLAVGASCGITVTATTVKSGDSGTLVVNSNATNSPATVTLLLGK